MADGWWVRHDSIAVTGGTKVLTLVEQRAGIITLTGVLASNQLIQFTGVEGFWIVQNDTTGAFSTKAVLAGPTAGVTLTQGATTLIYCNGTDMVVTTSLATTASSVTFSPTGSIAATNVQTAIAELDTEKQPIDATLTALAGATTAADKVPYFTGVDTVAVGDFTSFGRTLVAGTAVENTQLSDMAQSTIKGRAAGAGTGDPTDLTATQATAILNNVVGDSGSGGTKGLVPAPASGDAAASKYLKADGAWTAIAIPGSIINPSDTQTFTASGTWTKPGSGTYARIECWGGGGSGGKAQESNGGGGGGGGGYTFKEVLLSSLGATETVTIGAGGAAQSTALTAGNVGGNTTFGAHVTAYGGGPGSGAGAVRNGGGGGGGWTGAGSVGGQVDRLIYNAGAGGGGMGGWGAQNQGFGGMGFYGGGGGGFGDNNSDPGLGGDSTYGGAGGGGSSGGLAIAGGTSVFGGAGGASGIDSGNGTAGSQPGGGGGGSELGTSGAGGAGKCVVRVW